jgi:hypothetical protein
MQTFMQGLTPTESIDYSLWKATKKIKQVKKPSPPLRTSQGTWTSSNVEKAHAFIEHLQMFSSLIPQKINLKRKMHLSTSRDALPTQTTNQLSQKS